MGDAPVATDGEAGTPSLGPEAMARALRNAAAKRPLSLEASGTSMGRTIASGERARVEPADGPRWGEVWAFCDDQGAVLLHRCRRRRASGFVFQGDACPRPDPLVPPSRLIGRVVALERAGVVRPLGRRDRWAGGLGRELRHEGRRAAVRVLALLRLRGALERRRGGGRRRPPTTPR